MRKLLMATVAVVVLSSMADGAAQAQTPPPAPGTITVRLNGRFRFFAGIFDDQEFNTAGNKQSNYGFLDYARLFPGFDGVAANGLKYGASLEIRQDNATAPGGGVNGSVSAADRGRGTLYFRREWGYLGSDQIGTLRVGSTDSPTSLFLTGNFENFNDGGWNGDAYDGLAANSQLVWPFADVGSLYTTTKAIYLSPQFYGFDFGISYEPNTGNVNYDGGNCPFASGAAGTANVNGAIYGGGAGVGCDRLSSTTGGDYARRKNTVDAALRYRGTFGPVGLTATASFIGSGKVNDSSTPVRALQYDGLRLGDFGLAVTYAGFTVGGNFQYGRYNGQWALSPTGRRDGTAFVAGASYAIGPLIVGASYVDYISAGDVTLTSGRREQGVAAGATYTLAPGVSILAGYLWDQRRQQGFNFVSGADTGTTAALNNKIRAQSFYLGSSFTW